MGVYGIAFLRPGASFPKGVSATEAMDPSLVSLKPPHREKAQKGETIPNKGVFFSHDFPQCFLLLKVTIIMELKRLLGQLQIGYMTFFFFWLYDILGYLLHQRNKEKFSANSFKFCSTLLTFFSTSQFLKAV